MGVAWPHLEADSVALVEGVRVARACVALGQQPCPGISAYSLQQTAIAAVASLAGGTVDGVVRLLAVLSGVSVAVMAVLSVVSLPARHRGVGVGVVAAGPLLFYASSSFGEALATLGLVWFVIRLTRESMPGPAGVFAIGVAAAWAGLGKDTLPFVVGLLGVVVVGLDARRPRGLARRLGATAAGALAATLASAAFHWFRLGTVYNAEYVDHPEFFLSRPIDVASAFLGHWLSPSAGLIVFWPIAAAVLVASGRHGAATGAVVAAYAAGLSRWWAPFGWVAWGDRLLYPVVAAAVFVCLLSRPRRLELPGWVWAVSTLAALAAIAIAHDSRALALFFAPDATFPGPPTIQADAELYRAFLRHLTWQRTLDVGLLFAGLGQPHAIVIALATVAAIVVAARAAAPARSRP